MPKTRSSAQTSSPKMGASKPTPKPRAPKKSKTAPLPKDDSAYTSPSLLHNLSLLNLDTQMCLQCRLRLQGCKVKITPECFSQNLTSLCIYLYTAALEDANKQVPTGGGEAPPVATTKTARSALSKMRSQGTPVAKMNTPGSKATAPQTNLKTSTATPAPGTPISKHAKPNSATTIDNNGSNANSNHNPSDHPPSRCLKNVQAVIPLTKDPKTRKWLRPKGGHNKNWNLFVDYLSKLSGILKEDYNSMMVHNKHFISLFYSC